MIILDTNVVSETLYLTAVSLAELLAGIEVLPQGRRRLELEQAVMQKILPLFEGRILSFDARAAEACGKIRAGAQAVGNTIGFADGAIAAIASARGLRWRTLLGSVLLYPFAWIGRVLL